MSLGKLEVPHFGHFRMRSPLVKFSHFRGHLQVNAAELAGGWLLGALRFWFRSLVSQSGSVKQNKGLGIMGQCAGVQAALPVKLSL